MSARPTGPRRPWKGKRVVLGVTGGIAAYKCLQLARDLTVLGAEVDVVLSRGAREFVTPLAFQAVTGRNTLEALFSVDGAARHIRLGQEADVLLVAPATADFLSRAAQGRADDLLTTALLATRAPVILAPAMNPAMWAHPLTRENGARLCARTGYTMVGPEVGAMAVGEEHGKGRMTEPEELVEWVGRALGRTDRMAGRKVLVTAGPTREPLDPVRYLGNRSSGRMGFALARAAWRRGAEVTLVSGPSALADPPGVRVLRVERAEEMRDAAVGEAPEADVLLFAAAVADYRPKDPAHDKWKRGTESEERIVELVANPDVAEETRKVRKVGSFAVGFALETERLVERAREKLERKRFDLIVANHGAEKDAGFEVATNRVVLIDGKGEPEELPLLTKDEVAERILDRVEAMYPEGTPAAR